LKNQLLLIIFVAKHKLSIASGNNSTFELKNQNFIENS